MAPSLVTVARAITTPSNLLRRLLCPGSARMESGLPEDDSIDAQLGRLFHRYWANPNYERAFLTQDQRDLLELTDRLMLDVLIKLGFEIEHVLHVEQTFSMRSARLTGTPDRVYVWPKRETALVADLKSGFAQIERAELNLQLRGYAVIVADNFDLTDIYVTLLQPRMFFIADRISLAHYTSDDIEKSRGQIERIIEASEEKNAPLHAGEEQCRYCRAKLICPAFRKAVSLPVAQFKTEDELSKRAREVYIERKLKECSDEQLEQVLEACKLADQISYPARAEARERIRAGGYKRFVLGKDWSARVVTNVRKAIALLALGGITSRDKALDACTLSLDKIEEDFRAQHNGMTWKRAREKIDRALASVMQREEREPKIIKK